MAQSAQHITFSVSQHSGNTATYVLTAIYASPNWRQRETLWHSLTEFHNSVLSIQTPWLLMGDFNSIIARGEKFGGRQDPFLANARAFKDFVHHNDLIDLGFSGPKYTWNNCRQGRDWILERLDQALATPAWLDIFGAHSITHLTRITSDHYPIFLSDLTHTQKGKKPFRFENMWTPYPGFNSMLSQFLKKPDLKCPYQLRWGRRRSSCLTGMQKLLAKFLGT